MNTRPDIILRRASTPSPTVALTINHSPCARENPTSRLHVTSVYLKTVVRRAVWRRPPNYSDRVLNCGGWSGIEGHAHLVHRGVGCHQPWNPLGNEADGKAEHQQREAHERGGGSARGQQLLSGDEDGDQRRPRDAHDTESE